MQFSKSNPVNTHLFQPTNSHPNMKNCVFIQYTLKLLTMSSKKNLTSSALAIILLLFVHCSTETVPEKFFSSAQPVWPVGKESEKNMTVGFRTEFGYPKNKQAVLKIAGSTLYRIFLNGEFIGHGPARAGHGYYRMDEWDLSAGLRPGANVLAVETAGYNVNSYYLLDQPSFLQAEVVSGNKVLAATSGENDDFEAFNLVQRVQKVPRYSFQRPFVEYYRLENDSDLWRWNSGQKAEGRRQKSVNKEEEKSLKLEVTGEKKLIERRVAYPEFIRRNPVAKLSHGTLKTGIHREHYWKDRSVLNIGEELKGFKEEELVLNPAIELQEMEPLEWTRDSAVFQNGERIPLNADQFQILDLGTNLTGFIGADLEVTRAGRFYFTFDEILTNGDVDFKRLGCINAVTYDLVPGIYSLKSFEPYTLRYLKVSVLNGECILSNPFLREYVNPDIGRSAFTSGDERLNRIYRAGVETFRQNAVDIFMDCPSRERAGWLCDSYFTSRVANDLSGNTRIEKNFLENFALPDSFPHLPEGMLPMCYPADHNDGVFIPNWAMWFVIELKEYLDRSQDRQLVDDLEPRVLALLDYFKPFKNKDGLLEKLDSWIFVEWSAANNFVQDVNYPTNMLYAATLDAAGELYRLPDLRKEAESIRETIRKQSWNGEFFVDNAVRRQDGKRAEGQKERDKIKKADAKGVLEVTENTTEVCQYFAFYFGVATPELYPELWKKLSTEFGPKRQQLGLYPKVHPANSFVGNYIRLELLSRYNLRSQLIDESIDFFDYMAMKTGTLWENISPYASCDHGFASHVVHVLYRDILGIQQIDTRLKTITIEFSSLNLDFCEGRIPIGEELLELKWKRNGEILSYTCKLPVGYTVNLINHSGLQLQEEPGTR